MLIKNDARFEHELIEEYDDGECVFEEGDLGRDLYIVQKGHIRISKKTASGPVNIAEFKKGEFFGDMALLQSLPRYAAAYSKGETRLLILKPAGFLMKIRRDPTFAFEMLQQLSARVKISSDILLEIVKQQNLPADDLQKLIKSAGTNL